MWISLFNYDYEFWISLLNMLKKLFIINLLILFVLMLTGFICSYLSDEIISFPLIDESSAMDNPTRDFSLILKNNLFLLIYLLLGATTFGAFSVILFAWNAFFLGTGISSIVNLNGTTFISVYIYIFLEFSSLTFAVTAGEKIGIDFFGYLSESMKPKNPLATFLIIIISIFLMVISGIIETYYLYK